MDTTACTSILTPRKPLPEGSPIAKPFLLSEIIERGGRPAALAMVFAPDSSDPQIKEGELVAYEDSDGRLLELRTTRGIRCPDHLLRAAEKQGKWVVLTAPVEVVSWRRRKAGGE